ncbi:uromodulin-like [Mantella aurantiaca]
MQLIHQKFPAPPPPLVKALSDITLAGGDACCELVCSADWIELTIKVDTLKKMNVDIANIHLRDRRCTRFNYDNDYIHIKWSLGKDICGTDLIVADTHAVYRNHVYLPPDPTAIIYREDFIFNVSCSYPLNMTVSFDNILFPEISTTYIQMENGGQFGVKMSVYKDISYTTPYTDPIIHLSTKSNLYVGVYISEGDRAAFSLRMTNCYSTPTNNIYESLKYGMIINSCPNPRDSTINILENGISSQGKFYIQMFKFIGDYSVVYLHCEVYLCQNRCAPLKLASSRPEQDITCNLLLQGFHPGGEVSAGLKFLASKAW